MCSSLFGDKDCSCISPRDSAFDALRQSLPCHSVASTINHVIGSDYVSSFCIREGELCAIILQPCCLVLQVFQASCACDFCWLSSRQSIFEGLTSKLTSA